ncbi:MAG: hypothetical protein V4557_10580 [Bacteroidota bacterium]
MNNDFLNLKDQQVLYEIKEYLENISVQSTVVEASDHLPLNMLLAVTQEEVSVNIMYVPLPEDHFTEIRLLQLHSLIIVNTEAAKKNDLLVLLNELNNQSPFGTFAINEKGELGFKYIYPVSRFEMPKEEPFQETFSLYQNCLIGFRNVIIHVNSGELSLEDALKDVLAG